MVTMDITKVKEQESLIGVAIDDALGCHMEFRNISSVNYSGDFFQYQMIIDSVVCN